MSVYEHCAQQGCSHWAQSDSTYCGEHRLTFEDGSPCHGAPVLRQRDPKWPWMCENCGLSFRMNV